jgi:serine/threonine protein kinase
MSNLNRLVGSLGDRYEIERELGRGGMAVVYLARDRELDRPVAIKVLRAATAPDDQALPRLLREARLVGKLQHPNIVQVYDIKALDDDGLALIMQYVQGPTIRELIRASGPLGCRQAGSILIDVARALSHAHAKRIVHRDVKPENVHVDPDTGVAQLTDFGIARPWDEVTGLTLPGAALGTPAYMSPEQIDGQELDGRSDLYSLGLVGYEMLYGSSPFSGASLFDILEKQKRFVPPPLIELRRDVPPELSEAIVIATRKDREERFANADEFADTVASSSLPDGPPVLIDAAPPEVEEVSEDAETVVWRPGDTSQEEPRAPASTPEVTSRAKEARPRKPVGPSADESYGDQERITFLPGDDPAPESDPTTEASDADRPSGGTEGPRTKELLPIAEAEGADATTDDDDDDGSSRINRIITALAGKQRSGWGSPARPTSAEALGELEAELEAAAREAEDRGGLDEPEPEQFDGDVSSLQIDPRIFVIVETDLDFTNAVQLQPLDLWVQGQLRLRHGQCGSGEFRVQPSPFERTRRGRLRERRDVTEDDFVWLVCQDCGGRSPAMRRRDLEIALRRYLIRPMPSALEAYPLAGSSRLVPPGWTPPKRRRTPDRRRTEGRYDRDPSLLGRRRLGRDRRANPDELDVPPPPASEED